MQNVSDDSLLLHKKINIFTSHHTKRGRKKNTSFSVVETMNLLIKTAAFVGVSTVGLTYLASSPYAPFEIPETMSSIQSISKGKIGLVQDIPTASLIPTKPNQFLVKMAYAPVNPSDVYTALRESDYGFDEVTYPHTNGFEGSGTVVASGGGLIPFLYTFFNLNVAVIPGVPITWSEYVLVDDLMKSIPLFLAFPFWSSKNVNVLQKGSAAVVNPGTVMGFLETAKEINETSMVHTAANSALGKMLIRAANVTDVNIIAVVRGDRNERELVEDLQHDPELVIRSDKATFVEDLSFACKKLGTRLVFDAIAGPFTDQIAKALKLSGVEEPLVYVYGDLSGEMHKSKRKYPFWHLRTFLEEPGMEDSRALTLMKGILSMLKNELSTSFKHVVKLTDPKTIDVLKQYESHQKGGKIVISMEN